MLLVGSNIFMCYLAYLIFDLQWPQAKFEVA
jgi:hypothetical protein